MPEERCRLASALVTALVKHERPWGYFQVLYEDTHCKVKKLVIKPGQRTSLQRHLHRRETWVHVVGAGYTQVGEIREIFSPYRPPVKINYETWHRIENATDTIDLVIIETQTGSYFGEDDIERKEDDYGRTSAR